MQLILAIDSDLRRSEQLASLVNARLKVDLVHATSAGEGLHALKDRIPDLILTAPLLSPFDDGVLDEYLRDLGAAGAHVQTLRIPVLATGPSKQGLVNRLFVLGRTKTTSAAMTDGCDPKVFADEIAVYLSRAAEALQSVAHLVQAAPRHEEATTPTPVVVRPVLEDAMVMREAYIDEFADALEQSPANTVEPQYVDTTEPSCDMVHAPIYVDTPIHGEPTESWSVVEAQQTETPVIDATPDTSLMPDSAPPITTPEPERKAPGTSDTFEAALAAIRAAWVKPAAPAEATLPSTTTAAPRPASPGNADLTNSVDALEPTKRLENGRGREASTSARRPLQDEWGVFDAEQCGFSALVDKLDEVSESKDAPTRSTVTTRVISIR